VKAGYSSNSAHVTGSRLLRNEKVKDYIQSKKDEIIDDTILTAKETLYLLTKSAVGDETETKEVVVKRGEYKENPQSGKVQLVYNEHVELIEVPIKPSDRLKARDMLGKYHKLFTDKHDINGNVPIFINIGEWDGDDEELDKTVKEVSNANPSHTVIVDDIPLED
uniref:terminase small subunit n=2 Tax=Staphylococcus aureus TaxID=1280 RepID=UPI003F5ADF6A